MYNFEEPVGIYIGNNCNLSCNECITFSNFNFKKWFTWEDCKSYYEEWSRKVNFRNIYIFGGEPYANPELKKWAVNLLRLWPKSNFWILTNGTYIKENIELTQELIDLGYMIQISCKDKFYFEEINSIVPNLLKNKNVQKNIKTDNQMRPYTESEIFEYTLENKILLQVYADYYFLPSSIKEIKNGVLHFHNTDAEKTHSKCPMIPCNVICNGFFYKCSFMSTFSEARHQFKFEESAYQLLEQYQPCDPFLKVEEVISFLINLKKSIPQCSLCNYSDIDITKSITFVQPREKKIKLQNISI